MLAPSGILNFEVKPNETEFVLPDNETSAKRISFLIWRSVVSYHWCWKGGYFCKNVKNKYLENNHW